MSEAANSPSNLSTEQELALYIIGKLAIGGLFRADALEAFGGADALMNEIADSIREVLPLISDHFLTLDAVFSAATHWSAAHDGKVEGRK